MGDLLVSFFAEFLPDMIESLVEAVIGLFTDSDYDDGDKNKHK